jgi:hypothetical protein
VEGVSGYGKVSTPNTKPNEEAVIQDGTVAETVIIASEEWEKIS